MRRFLQRYLRPGSTYGIWAGYAGVLAIAVIVAGQYIFGAGLVIAAVALLVMEQRRNRRAP